MKNNILLILAVTIISIGIIVATVLISTSGGDDAPVESSRPSTSDTSSKGNAGEGTISGEPITQVPTDETSGTSATTGSTTIPVLSPDESTQSDISYDSDMADGIIATAKSLIGIGFMDGGDTPEYGFDNSGFIYYVLRENGYITCPRELASQSEMGAALAYEELRPGDLAFFYADDMKTIGFGGIYCGDGIMIACLMPGTQVKEINITTPFYTGHFYRGVSLT